MPATAAFKLRHLDSGDVGLLRELLSVFATAFDEAETYTGAQPNVAYLESLLDGEQMIALVAIEEGVVTGGLVAYELKKFEQERSEIYIYDLAVAQEHRRKGVATALIEELQSIGAARGAFVIFVQADPPDVPAVALYTKLGSREDVLHFDISVGEA